MASMKVRLGGKWVTVAGGGVSQEDLQHVVNEANDYANKLKEQIDDDIKAMGDTIEGLETNIEGAFSDGIITKTEARRIQSYINTLDTNKARFDKEYKSLIENEFMNANDKQGLISAKTSHDEKFDLLIKAINDAIADGKATVEEATHVNTSFANYNNAAAVLTSAIYEAIDDIATNKTGVALEEAKTFASQAAEGVKTILNAEVDGVKKSVTDLDTEIKGAFRDGIIQENELSSIKTYLNTLDTSKQGLDKRYDSTYNNVDLPAQNKTNLVTVKIDYDRSYNDLINTINDTILDQLGTPEEQELINTKFKDYNQKLALLTTQLELAIEAISKTKSTRAEKNAKDYSDQIKGEMADEIQGVEDATTALKTEVHTTFKDGIIDASEAQKIKSYINLLDNNKKALIERYNELVNNGFISPLAKTTLISKQTLFDTKYGLLISEINNAIADGQTTVGESQAVDTAFNTYNDSVKEFTNAMEKAADSIAQGKANAAEFNAGQYADEASNRLDVIKVRYIKNTLTGNSVNAYKHWTEIKAISKGVNVATTGTVTGSTGVTNLGVVNNDKVDDQFAEDRTTGESWVQIDLGTVKEDIDYIQLWHFYSDARTYNGNKVEVSADGQKWYTMFSSDKSGTYKESADGFIIPVNAGRIYNHTIQRISTTETQITNINGVLQSVVKNTEFEQGIKESKEHADAVAQAVRNELSNFSNLITTRIDGIEDQVDGNITTWFLTGAPTLTNAPAVDWNTDSLKDTHLGDLYYDSATGYCYRFLKNGLIYAWAKITDSDVTEAIQKAAKAQDTADGKRRVFVVQPIPPYDVGDLWAQGSAGDLMRCSVAKAEGALYNAGDWSKASKYVDQKAVNDTLNPFVTRLETAESSVTQNAREISERVKIDTYNQEITNINTNIGNIDSAQKGTADKLDKLAIGGRNLLKNSGNFVTIENWSSLGTTTATVMLDKDDLKISKVGLTAGVHVVNPSLRRLEWDVNKDYVITVRAKGSAAFSLDVGITGDNGTNVVLPFATVGSTGTDYKEFTLVFKPKVNGVADFRISTTPIPNGSSLWIDWVKVEAGNKATAWSPAPEDLTDYADVAVGKILDSSFEKGLRFWSGYNATIDVGAPLQSSVVYGTSSDSLTGRTAMSISNAEGWIFSANAIPVDTSRVYRVRFRIKKTKDVTGGGTNVYAGVATYDKNGNLQTTSPGNHRYCAVAGKPLKVADGWQLYEGYITGEGNATHNQFRPGTAYVKPMFVVDYQAGVGGTNIIDLVDFEDVTSQIKAQDYSETKIGEAKVAQEEYARAQAEAAKIVANAYADGIVDAEEQRAIDDANAKLAQAKAHAEQKAKEAQDAAQGYVDGIEIGGTNLLKNSGFKDGLNYWSIGSNVAIDPTKEFEGYPTVVNTQTGRTEDAWQGINSSPQWYSCKPGDNFVGSIYTYTENIPSFDRGAFVIVDFYDINGTRINGWQQTSIVPSKQAEWQKFVVKGTAPANAVKVRMYAFINRNGKLWYAKPQLEKGTKATAWGLAPEDIVEAIGKIKVGGKNLLVGSDTLSIISNNPAIYPITVTKMTEGAVSFNRVKNSKAGTDVNTISVYNAIPFNVISDNLAGKQVTFSHQVRASKATEGTLMHELYGGSTLRLPTANTKFSVTTDWQTVTATVDLPSNLSTYTGVRFLLSAFSNMVDQHVDFRTIKIEFGNRATDWTPAPEDVNKLISDVDTKAQNVTGRVDDMSADGKLTSLEKQDAKKDWDIIAGEYSNFYTQADAFGITSQKATYKTRYDELNAYLTPLFVKMNETSDIVRTDYRLKFKNYFEAKSALAKAISDASKTQIDSISIGGRNVVLGTSVPKSMVGTNISNQTTNIYDFAGGNSQKILNKEVSISFDWIIEGTAGGTMYLQGSNPYPLIADKITFSASNTSGRYTVTRTITGSPFVSINMRLDGVPVGAKVTISNLKIELGNRITDWTPAPEDIDKLISDLDTKATNLQTSVDTMSDDNQLTPSEKSLLKKDWDSIVIEYPTISAQADAFGATAEKTNYTNAYNALKGLIETPLANVTTTSPVNGADMRNKFKDYSDRKSKLLRYLSDSAKSQIDGISVGGRNLVSGTSFKDSVGWTRWSTYETIGVRNDAFNNLDFLFFETKNASGVQAVVPVGTALGLRGTERTFAVKKDVEYTISMVVATSELNNILNYCYIMYSDGTGVNQRIPDIQVDSFPKYSPIASGSATYFYKVSVTIRPNKDDNKAHLLIGGTLFRAMTGSNGYAWIRVAYLKVEEGNRPTTWSPSFEDIFGDIKSADDKAQKVQDSVNDMSADNKITALEKHQASKDWEGVKAEYPVIAAQADAFGKTTEKTNYTNAYNALKNYIEPILVKLNETSDIDGANYRGLWKNYSDTKSKLGRAVTDGSKDAIDNISVGGRNLLLGSQQDFNTTDYLIKQYTLSENWVIGQEYTFMIKGTVPAGQKFGIWMNGGSNNVGYATTAYANGVTYVTFKAIATTSGNEKVINLYNFPSNTTASTVDWVALYKGNKPMDWTPAPEDVQSNIDNITVGSRNYLANGDFSTDLEDDPNKGYYLKGDVQDIVDITNETPPHKKAFHCKNTAAKNNGQSSIPIFIGGAASDLFGKEITVSAWIKYQNVVQGAYSYTRLRALELVIEYKKADGTSFYDYPSVINAVGTDMTWKKVFRTIKLNHPDAKSVVKVSYKSMLEGCIGEFWITGQKVEIGNKVTDWTPMPEEINNVISTVTTRVGTVEATTKNLGDSITNKVWLTDVYTKQEILSKLAEGDIYVRGTGFNHGGNRVLKINGATKYDLAANRGLRLTTLSRANLAIVDDINYDTYNNPAQQTALNDKLNSLDNSVLVVLSSWDAVNILKGALLDTIANFGGSGGEIVYRTPYVLIGLKGLGKGSGIEVMTGQDKASYPVAEVYTKVSSGVPQGFNTSAKVLNDTVTNITTRVDTAESAITQHAKDIELKVNVNGVIAAINLSPEIGKGVLIQGENIMLDGKVKARHLAVTDLANIVGNSDLKDGLNGYVGGTLIARANANRANEVPTNYVIEHNARDLYYGDMFPINKEEVFSCSMMAKQIAGTALASIGLAFYAINSAGTTTQTNWIKGTTFPNDTDIPNTPWKTQQGLVTAPSWATHARVWVQIDQPSGTTTTKWQFTLPTVRRTGLLTFDQAKGGTLELGEGGRGVLRVYATVNGNQDTVGQIDENGASFTKVRTNLLDVSGRITAPNMVSSNQGWMELFVDPANNGNYTPDGTQARPYKTMRDAISSLPKYLEGDVEIKLQSDVYEEWVDIKGFVGGGGVGGTNGIFIRAGTNGRKTIWGGIRCWFNSCHIYIQETNVSNSRDQSNGVIEAYSCSKVSAWNCNFTGNNKARACIYSDNSTVIVNGCEMYDAWDMIRCVRGYVCVLDCRGGNCYCVLSSTAGTIQGGGTRPGFYAGGTERYTDQGGWISGSWTENTGSWVKPTPPVTIQEATIDSVSSKSWRENYGGQWYRDEVLQGTWDGWGNYRGMWFFGNKLDFLKGKTILDMTINIGRTNGGGYSSAQQVSIRNHNEASQPSGMPYLGSPITGNYFAWGERKSINVKALAGNFSSGNARGFGIYTDSASPYMIFDGWAQVWVKYQ
ncbi:tail fiber protein [Bacillus phage JL]|uniref:Tail fiber protein n=1 Tax=Bacillus phage JL TaxID=1296655 RepID=S5MSK9_9CAUD|nr:tail protein [Bacillus phage JL]AGR46787.1 tail fiber protein [Bacillus phage JL]